MFLRDLSITNFKNIPQADLHFGSKINALLGNNGMGKSNLLDAIYYLSFCKSFSGIPDQQLISYGEDFCTLRGQYLRRDVDEELTLGLAQGRRKSFRRGGKEYERLSAHIGAFPLIITSPADQQLINGTGEERRRLMDMVIAQSDAPYLDHLIRYGKALQQRNHLLHIQASDPSLYEALEYGMSLSAAYITRRRQAWVERLTSIFLRHYSAIAASGERPQLRLTSHLDADPDALQALLDQARSRDRLLGHTTVGPHRDDIELLLNEMPVRRTASQGQCKTYTLALRLAQYEFLAQAVNLHPLLLLDDLFDRLDASRVERVVEVVAAPLFGQIFITDTNRDHLDSILSHSPGDHRLWQVDHGVFSQL